MQKEKKISDKLYNRTVIKRNSKTKEALMQDVWNLSRF